MGLDEERLRLLQAETKAREALLVAQDARNRSLLGVVIGLVAIAICIVEFFVR